MKLWFNEALPVLLKIFRFPGGEMQVRIINEYGFPATLQEARIEASIKSSDDLMALLVLTDAVRRLYPAIRINLVCPYLPYARQDRVVYPGEALAAAVACKLINAQGYETVEVWDLHSDVTAALLDRVTNRPASDFARKFASRADIVVAPDHGALRRAKQVADLSGSRLVVADKVRDPDTGKILETTVRCGPVGGADFLIVDDICDGGRTFTELAKVLRPLTTGRIRLYVTHGIFSAGFGELEAHFDAIHVANPFPETLPDFVQAI